MHLILCLDIITDDYRKLNYIYAYVTKFNIPLEYLTFTILNFVIRFIYCNIYYNI
jgi:hypothetical protein